nr:uncharacterized protein LOC111424830 [Onthophagus taurus]
MDLITIRLAMLLGVFLLIITEFHQVVGQQQEELTFLADDGTGSFKVLAFAGPMRRSFGRIVRDSRVHEGNYLGNNGFYVPYNPGAEEFYTDGSYKGEKIYWFKGKRIYW